MDGANQPISDLYYALDMAIEALEQTESNSEKPNNCEHITEDGVTCAKYPACGDCPDNPLNKVKGSERLVKGSEQTEPTISKMEQVEDDAYFLKLMGAVERGEISDAGANQAWYEHINHKDEPQTEVDCDKCKHEGEYNYCHYCENGHGDNWYEPQTERSE